MNGILIVLILIALALFSAIIIIYNRFVRSLQLIREAESGIDVQLKRRYDLVPNLVEVVKGYASHENRVLEEVTRLRSHAAEIKGLVPMRAGAENALSAGLRSVFALAEYYPQLKADQHFLQLHEALVATENELQMARRYYNGTVRAYNVLVQSFPSNILAVVFNYKTENFFEIETATEGTAPKVDL